MLADGAHKGLIAAVIETQIIKEGDEFVLCYVPVLIENQKGNQLSLDILFLAFAIFVQVYILGMEMLNNTLITNKAILALLSYVIVDV